MNRLVLLLVCSAVAAQAAFAQAPGGAIRRSRDPIRNQYIVMVAPTSDGEAVGREAEMLFRGRLKHVYRRALRGFSIRLTDTAAAALARDPRVILIEEDAQVRATDVQAAAPWGLDRIDQRALPLDSSYTHDPLQVPVYVHVLDTGVRQTHVEFGGRAFLHGDYVDDDADADPLDVENDDTTRSGPDAADCHGHGTHVAGTIGGATYGVSKQVELRSHRVLDCSGVGAISSVIAALDVVASDVRRPAVANMSLASAASAALDEAVRQVIAAGVTMVVAAGNDRVDAGGTSPARVPEAITVGATGASDGRADFSNFGAILDVFAPGVSIVSAWFGSDTSRTQMSGTSMAAPHVAGVAARYLARHPSATPAQVRSAIVGAATRGRVGAAGTGSPNLLLYSGFLAPVAVTLTSPDGGEKWFTAARARITWQASDGGAFSRFDAYVSADAGATWKTVTGCSALPATARECWWAAPAPATARARIRVVGRLTSGDGVGDESAASFTIATGAPVLKVSSPNSAVNWGRGSTQYIKWTHNLGANSSVRVELSRDGGATFSETLAPAVRNSSATAGSLTWRVTGPNVAAAVVRVSWTGGGASDVSDTRFTIAEPYVKVTSPSASSPHWGYGTKQRRHWATNLGPLDRIDVRLSTDGGATFPTRLAGGASASTLYADLVVPTLPAPTNTARIQMVWVNAPSGVKAAGVNPVNFQIGAPFVTVTAPNGGEAWTAGTAATIRWASNLGTLEQVRVELSRDGGATYATVLLPSTPSDGSQGVTVNGAWLTSKARVRVSWIARPSVGDSSNANFAIR